jgi:hypothetical protein
LRAGFCDRSSRNRSWSSGLRCTLWLCSLVILASTVERGLGPLRSSVSAPLSIYYWTGLLWAASVGVISSPARDVAYWRAFLT